MIAVRQGNVVVVNLNPTIGVEQRLVKRLGSLTPLLLAQAERALKNTFALP